MNIQGPRNLFMPSSLVGLLLFLVSSASQAAVLFNCTFNDGLLDDCLFQSLLPSTGASLQTTAGKEITDEKIDQPLSDATSVCK